MPLPSQPLALKPFWTTSDGETVKLFQGDVISVLKRLPSKIVQCVTTSPPYWGLRDYGTAEWNGGNSDCDHRHQRGGEGTASAVQSSNSGSQLISYVGNCKKCGATRTDQQLGSEKLHDCLGWATGDMCKECFICHMVLVFREVRRVLRDDGTIWLNIGDTYGGGGNTMGDGVGGDSGKNKLLKEQYDGMKGANTSLAPGNLCMIPFRLALALQANGWVLRQDIIWKKPSPMPESVTNRCCKSHEYILLLTKGRDYYFDHEAIKEKASGYKNLQEVQTEVLEGPILQEQSAKGRTDGEVQILYGDCEKGLGQEVQQNTKSQENGKEILLLREGAENKAGLSKDTQTDARTKGSLPISNAGSRKETEVQITPKEVRSEYQGENCKSGDRQAILENRKGPICKTKSSNQEKTSIDGNGLHTDKGSMVVDQEKIQEQVCILQESVQAVRDGSRNASIEGRVTYSGECGSILQNMQCKEGEQDSPLTRNKRSVWSVDDEQALFQWMQENDPEQLREFLSQSTNKTDVWKVSSQAYSGAHFATFPYRLIEPCILAGSSAYGCCEKCGSPWKRVTQQTQLKRDRPNEYVKRTGEAGTGNSCSNSVAGVSVKTLGWEPSCKCYTTNGACNECGAMWGSSGDVETAYQPEVVPVGNRNVDASRGDKTRKIDGKSYNEAIAAVKTIEREKPCDCLDDKVVPCTVLDPFIGSGTTSCVSLIHGRRSVGIDLSETYLKENAIPRITGELMKRPALAHLAGHKTQKVTIGKAIGKKL